MPGGVASSYPAGIKTATQRALYSNLGKDEGLTLAVDVAVQNSLQDGWRSNTMKTTRVRNAIRAVLNNDILADQILELAKHQNEY